MALATANANLARQKAYNAVYGSGTDNVHAASPTDRRVSPYHFYAVKAFFLHMAANKNNPDLQFVPYSAEQVTTNGGYNPDVDVCTLYLWFIRGRRTSGTTAAFMAIHDATSNGATTTTVATQLLNAAGQSAMFAWPDGFPIATDVTLSAADAVGGSTEASAANAADGFLIVGA